MTQLSNTVAAPGLTQNETYVLDRLADNDFMDGLTGRDAVGKELWSDCIYAPDLPSTSIPGVVSSLSKKGLVKCAGTGRDATLWLTEAGAAIVWPEAFGGDFPIEGGR